MWGGREGGREEDKDGIEDTTKQKGERKDKDWKGKRN